MVFNSSHRSKMPVADRAKQFMPFSAVKGLSEALSAKERIVIPKAELSPEMADELDYKMHQLKCGHIVCIIFFQKDQYIRTTGMVARIDETSRLLQIVNTRISFDDIYDIESDLPNAFCNTP